MDKQADRILIIKWEREDKLHRLSNLCSCQKLQIDTAETVDIAQECLRQHIYKGIILNFSALTETESIEICQQITSLDVFIIGIVEIEDREQHEVLQSRFSNIAAYLVEPFDLISLSSILNRWLMKSRKPAEMNCFWVKTGSNLVRVKWKAVEWVKKHKNGCMIQTTQGIITADSYFEDIQRAMPISLFDRQNDYLFVRAQQK